MLSELTDQFEYKDIGFIKLGMWIEMVDTFIEMVDVFIANL